MSLTTAQLTHPIRVLKRVQETADAVLLSLDIPPELKEKFKYEARQFVTFFMEINGENLNRSYSLCSAPGVDQDFQIAVKKVSGGKGSTFLCDVVKEGDVLNTTPPAGHFFKNLVKPQGVHFFLFAAGSGITPIFSILKRVLVDNEKNRVTLLYCNRDENSIIFKSALSDWQGKYGARLEVVHQLSKKTGRLNEKLISNLLKMSATDQPMEFYSCGPTPFMEMIRNTLLSAKMDRTQIHEENFAIGVSNHKPDPKNPHWTYIGPGTNDGTPEKLIATIDGNKIEVDVKPGLSILELLIEAGANPPYSCMAGACMACLAKVEAGQAYQEDPGILVDENIEKCEALTCQAKPLSRVVKVSYDNL
jgi:ferredoxin-NADP reductase